MHKGNYFILNNYFNVSLINIFQLSIPPLIFNNHLITKQNILEIINHQSPLLPFNCKIYTSYQFIKRTARSKQFILMGDLTTDLHAQTVHLFISPHLKEDFDVFVLDSITCQNSSSDFLSNILLPEGELLYTIKNPKEIILNQRACICEHPETKTMTMPTSKSFKNLGMKQKYVFLNLNLHILFLCRKRSAKIFRARTFR